jgi:hypothetical protein
MPTTASSKAEQAGDSASLELVARAGLVAYGVVHLLIGWLAVQIAWSASDSKSADASGGLKTLLAARGRRDDRVGHDHEQGVADPPSLKGPRTYKGNGVAKSSQLESSQRADRLDGAVRVVGRREPPWSPVARGVGPRVVRRASDAKVGDGREMLRWCQRHEP